MSLRKDILKFTSIEGWEDETNQLFDECYEQLKELSFCEIEHNPCKNLKLCSHKVVYLNKIKKELKENK